MNIRQRITQFSKRIVNSGVANPAKWLVEWAQRGGPTASGETVNEETALGLIAYLACIKNVSEDIAKLPFGIYRGLTPSGSELLRDHPVTRLLHHEANDEMTAMSFRETMTAHAMGWKGGFAEIVRDRSGIPLALYPLDPTQVQRMRDYGPEGRLYYSVAGQRFERFDIFDIHGLGFDGITGYVLASLAREPIGNFLATQKFAGSFFGNGTVTTGVIEAPEAMSETAFKHLRESFHERHGGGKNAHKPIILEEGAKWTAQTANAEQSQMIESLYFGIEEVCRLFRVPPHKVQHLLRATFSNIEMQALEYVQDTLLAWLCRWEQEVWRKLLLPRERKELFAKHNVNMLLRGDTSARSTFYREMFNIGAFSTNEIRDKEDMNPIDGGDAHFVNAALVPLDMAANGEHLSQNQPEPAAEPTPPAENTDSPQAKRSEREHRRELVGRVGAAHLRAIEDAVAGVLRVEHDKVSRAIKKPQFQAWADGFYGESHPKYVADRLIPAITALSASVDAVVEGVPLA